MAEVKDKIVTVESLAALHEYNKNTYFSVDNTAELASVIQALIDDGSVCTLRSATRIENAAISSGSSFTGTGKGKLFVACNSRESPASLIIDGNDIGVPELTMYGGSIDIEFLESFSITTSNTTTLFFCNAVYY